MQSTTSSAKFSVSVEGTSKVTILSLDGEPIARFYAGRFDDQLLKFIVDRLNASQVRA